MLIRTKKKIVPSIGQLHWLAAKHIFEKANCSVEDGEVLQESIDAWSKKVNLTDAERWEILRITNALIADEHGHFERAKQLLILHRITYRDLYRAGLPFIAEPYKCRTYGRG